MVSNERPCFFHGIKKCMKYVWVPSSQRHLLLCEWGKRCMLSVSWHLQKKNLKTHIWKNLFVPDEVFPPDETEVLIQQGGWDASYKPLGYLSPPKSTLLALEISSSHNGEIWFCPLITLIRNSRISIFHTFIILYPTRSRIFKIIFMSLMVLTWWLLPIQVIWWEHVVLCPSYPELSSFP